MPLVVRQEPGVEMWYVNESLWFTFGIPAGLVAEEGFRQKGSIYVRIRVDEGQEYLRVLVTPVKDEEVLPEGTPVQIGGVSGIAVSGASDEWDGPTEELWFDRDGYRYHITVRARDGELLDFVRKTWHWERQ